MSQKNDTVTRDTVSLTDLSSMMFVGMWLEWSTPTLSQWSCSAVMVWQDWCSLSLIHSANTPVSLQMWPVLASFWRMESWQCPGCWDARFSDLSLVPDVHCSVSPSPDSWWWVLQSCKVGFCLYNHYMSLRSYCNLMINFIFLCNQKRWVKCG